jgi:hypothetical protein
MLNFKDAKQQENNGEFANFIKFTTGIHNVKVLRIAHQPVGNSVLGETLKGDVPRTYSIEQILVEVECTETLAGTDCKGGKNMIGLLPPQTEEQNNRLFSILKNISSTAGLEATEKSIRSWNYDNMEQLAVKMLPMVGRSSRMKFIADKTKKHVNLAGYYNSVISEPADVPFEKSEIKYNAKTEATLDAPSAPVEKPNTASSVASTPNDDLPF